MMGMHACVYTHAHMCLSMCMYSVNVHVYPCSFSHVRIWMCVRCNCTCVSTFMLTCVCMHGANMCVHSCSCSHVHAWVCVWYECTCLSMFLLMCVYGATIHVYPHSCSRVCIYIHIHAHMCLHVCGSSELTDNVFLDRTLFIYLFTDTRSLVAARTPNSS